jgi:hypothetical protein
MKKPIKHIDDLAPGLKDVKILLKIDEVKGQGEYAVSDSTGEALLKLGTSDELKRDVFYWALVQEVVPRGPLLQICASEVQPMVVEENAPVGHVPLHPKTNAPHMQQGVPSFQGQSHAHAGGQGAHGYGGYGQRRSGGGAHAAQGYRGGSRGGSYDGGQGGYGRSSYDGGHGQRGNPGGFRASAGGAYHGAGAPMMHYQQPQQTPQIVYGVVPQQQVADFGGVYGYGGSQVHGGPQGGDPARCAPHGQQQQGSAMGYGY